MGFKRWKKETVTLERLCDLLDYDKDTGIFTWKRSMRGGKGIQPGARAGTIKSTARTAIRDPKRYRYIRIDQVDYLAKRLAWFWMHGYWPTYLRCLDDNEDNCAIANLEDQGYVPSKKGENRMDQRARYAKRNADKIRKWRLGYAFGITPEQYDEMLADQNGVCAICFQPEKRKRNGKVRDLAVDHCHDSHEVRGLLCGDCNIAIGFLAHDTERLRSAIAYLERTNGGGIDDPHPSEQRLEEPSGDGSVGAADERAAGGAHGTGDGNGGNAGEAAMVVRGMIGAWI